MTKPFSTPFQKRFQASLQAKREDELLRTRTVVEDDFAGVIHVAGNAYLNFAGNDYLGLRHDERVLQSFVEGLSKYGAGSGASPLVTGYSIAHQQLEEWLAESLQREAVLLFSSGFAANHAICQALLTKNDIVITDKLMHASFLEGAMQSPAVLKRFAHNDMTHAQKVIQQSHADACILASEGVFSMDGDTAPIEELVTISQASGATLMLDDAHAIGVIGDKGLGSVDAHQLSQDDCPIVLGTFGKAVGTGGAFVAGSQDLIDYLVNHAKHYIYSTAPSAASARATLTALKLVVTGEERARLHSNIAQFCAGAKTAGLPVLDSNTAIQPLIIGAPEKTLACAEYLRNLGLWVGAIRSPTVPKGSDRLRITLSAIHQQKDIQALLDGLCLMRDKFLAD